MHVLITNEKSELFGRTGRLTGNVVEHEGKLKLEVQLNSDGQRYLVMEGEFRRL